MYETEREGERENVLKSEQGARSQAGERLSSRRVLGGLGQARLARTLRLGGHAGVCERPQSTWKQNQLCALPGRKRKEHDEMAATEDAQGWFRDGLPRASLSWKREGTGLAAHRGCSLTLGTAPAEP